MMNYGFGINGKKLELTITGTCMRIESEIDTSFAHRECFYLLQKLAEDLRARKFTARKISTNILGDVVMDPHPVLREGIFGPIVTMFDGEFVLNMREVGDYEFCIALLRDTAKVIQEFLALNMLSVVNPASPAKEPIYAIKEGSEVVYITYGSASFKIPLKHAPALVEKLTEISPGCLPFNKSLSKYESLSFIYTERYQHCQVRYESPTCFQTLDLYYEHLPELLALLCDALDIKPIGRIYHNEPEFRHAKPLKQIPSVRLGNIHLTIPENSITSINIVTLRQLFYDISERRFRRPHHINLGPAGAPNELRISLDLHSKCYGLLLRVGKYLRFGLKDPKEVGACLTFLQTFIQEAERQNTSSDSVSVEGYEMPSISLDFQIGMGHVYGGRVGVSISQGLLLDNKLVEANFMIPELLKFKHINWLDPRVITEIQLEEGKVALRTTGLYREVDLHFIASKSEQHLILGLEQVMTFLREVNKHTKAGNSREKEFIKLEKELEACFSNEIAGMKEPEVGELEDDEAMPPLEDVPSIPEMPIMDTRSWDGLRPEEREKLVAYIISAPPDVRKALSKVALIGISG